MRQINFVLGFMWLDQQMLRHSWSSQPAHPTQLRACSKCLVSLNTPDGLVITAGKSAPGTSLVVLWLRPCASNAGHAGLIPDQGTKIPHALYSQKSFFKKRTIQPLWPDWEVVPEVERTQQVGPAFIFVIMAKPQALQIDTSGLQPGLC